MECVFRELFFGKNVIEVFMIVGFDILLYFVGIVKWMMGMFVFLFLKDSEFLKVY